MMFSFFTSQPTINIDLPPLKLFNSETRQLEVFTPRKSYEVTLYSCGPTVHDFVHIGNLRSFLLADILKRTLEYNGYRVNHTMNFTDFGHLSSDADSGEDKILNGLKREGLPLTLENMRTFTSRFIEYFKDDAEAFGLIPPTQYTRASDYVKEQITLIKTLTEKGYTYATSDGIYFDIAKFPSYGRLGKIDVSALKNGARVETNVEKHHPADFALWKNSDLGWSSPWGKGFPGWHIECSAMAMTTLGKQIDIHTGGVDNAPTHHNAEIAQSESATGKQFVRYWLHGEHMQINSEKMSKSLGTGLTLSDLFSAGYGALTFRYWLLTSHYKTKINFTYEALTAAEQALTRLKRFVYEECTDTSGVIHNEYRERFISALNTDLDTPKAIATLWEMIKDAQIAAPDKRATIIEFDSVLGIGLSEEIEVGRAELGFLPAQDIPEEIQSLVDKREAARIARNWDEADLVREQLASKGYTVEDTPEGPRVSKTD